MRWRTEIIAFADAMEKELRQNDHKGGWSDCSAEWLLKRIADERGELARAIKAFAKAPSDETKTRVLSEAADVANFAMMVPSVLDALPEAARADTMCNDHCLDSEEIVCSKCYERHTASYIKNAKANARSETVSHLVGFVKDGAARAFIRGDDEQAKFLRALASDIEAFAKTKEAA